MKKLMKKIANTKKGTAIKNIFTLKREDATAQIVRIPSNLIKSPNNPKGLFERWDLVTVRNPDNGEFVVRKAVGPGSVKLFGSTVALDRDGQTLLGLKKDGECELLLSKSKWIEIEHYLCYQDSESVERYKRLNTFKAIIFGGFGSAIAAWGIAIGLSAAFGI